MVFLLFQISFILILIRCLFLSCYDFNFKVFLNVLKHDKKGLENEFKIGRTMSSHINLKYDINTNNNRNVQKKSDNAIFTDIVIEPT